MDMVTPNLRCIYISTYIAAVAVLLYLNLKKFFRSPGLPSELSG